MRPFVNIVKPWSPWNLNPICWLDPEREPYDPGDPVSYMADRTGHGKSFSQANASKRPVYRFSAANQQPYLEFDLVDDVLLGDGAGVEAANYLIAAVAKRTASGSEGVIWANGSVAPAWPKYHMVFRRSSLNTLQVYYDEGPFFMGGTVVPTNNFTVGSLRANGTSINIYQNNSLTDDATYNTPDTMLAYGEINAGAGGSLGGWHLGDLIFIAGAVNDADYARLRNWLMQKWKLT